MSYMSASERAMERWYGEPNMAHVIPNEPQQLPPTDLDCDHEHWRVCTKCGLDDGPADE